MTSAVAYVRISSADLKKQAKVRGQDPQKLTRRELAELAAIGVLRQREDVAKLAQQLGADLVEIYEDNSVSASHQRKADSAWERMFAELPVREPDLLLAAVDDRLDRNFTDYERLEQYSRTHHLRVVTADGEIDWDAATTPIMAGVRKAEALRIAKRVRRAQQARRDVGLDHGGARSFGYDDERNVIPEEAEIIHEIVRRFLGGKSKQSIVRWLREQGIRTTQGSAWTMRSIDRLLRNPRYIGVLTYKGEELGEAAWPGIITKDDFLRVQAALEETKRPYGGRPATTLLGGIARCGHCETALVGTTKAGHNKTRGEFRYGVYICPKEKYGCGRLTRKRALVDAWVTDKILKDLDTSVLDAERDAIQAQIDEHLQKSAEIELALYELEMAYREGDIDKLGRMLGGRRYYDRRDDLRRENRKLERIYTAEAQRLQELTHERAARERWESWTTEERRAFIRSHTEAVLVFKPETRGRATCRIYGGEIKIVPRLRLAEQPSAEDYYQELPPKGDSAWRRGPRGA